VAAPAFASTIDTFTITDNLGTSNSPVYTFSLPSSPTGISSNSNSFTITGVTVLTNGGNSKVDNIAFLTQATAGVLVEFASPRGAELLVEDPGNAFSIWAKTLATQATIFRLSSPHPRYRSPKALRCWKRVRLD
jgi:hypothetical protein